MRTKKGTNVWANDPTSVSQVDKDHCRLIISYSCLLWAQLLCRLARASRRGLSRWRQPDQEARYVVLVLLVLNCGDVTICGRASRLYGNTSHSKRMAATPSTRMSRVCAHCSHSYVQTHRIAVESEEHDEVPTENVVALDPAVSDADVCRLYIMVLF